MGEARLNVLDLELEAAQCGEARQRGHKGAALLLQHGGGSDGEAGEARERSEAGEAQRAGHERSVEERPHGKRGEPRQRRHRNMHATCTPQLCTDESLGCSFKRSGGHRGSWAVDAWRWYAWMACIEARTERGGGG